MSGVYYYKYYNSCNQNACSKQNTLGKLDKSTLLFNYNQNIFAGLVPYT